MGAGARHARPREDQHLAAGQRQPGRFLRELPLDIGGECRALGRVDGAARTGLTVTTDLTASAMRWGFA